MPKLATLSRPPAPPTPACPGCPAPTPCDGCWLPPLEARWQYQLQAKPGVADDTGGIDVDICEPPADGGTCVTPEVFDIDLYVDTKVSGEGNFVINTAAVDAIHASGGHAICYVDAGDAETYRPDYQRFVAFDGRCDGCLIGNPFSQVFPDEFFLNLNNDQGQRDFILKVNRARVKKCAGAGFDAVEWDIIDTYEDPHSGFHISYRTQLKFNTRLANMAHEFGMSVAMKNDPSQIARPPAVLRLRDRRGMLRVRLLHGEPFAGGDRVHRGRQSRVRGGVPADPRHVLPRGGRPGHQRDQEEPDLLLVRPAVSALSLIAVT